MATKQTPLYDEHTKLGAKMIDFGGWQMPASYGSVVEEHTAVRNGCGIFDVSHMGEFFVEGPEALACLQNLTINDLERLEVGQGQYTAMLNPQGGMIDDLILYRLADQKYLLCVNAANIEKDFDWVLAKVEDFNCKVQNRSSEYSQIAIQGPKADAAINELLGGLDQHHSKLAYMDITEVKVDRDVCYLARTGYTGELGYEIYLPNAVATRVWQDLLACKSTKVLPIGLGARDTLRLEACYLLYGNDMNDSVTPYEAGIAWAVRLNKEFIGKAAIVDQKEKGIPRKIIAFRMEDKGIARQGMAVWKDGKQVGQITSGSMLPTCGFAGGMALVDHAAIGIGDTFEIDVRGKRKLAKAVKRPLYSAKVK